MTSKIADFAQCFWLLATAAPLVGCGSDASSPDMRDAPAVKADPCEKHNGGCDPRAVCHADDADNVTCSCPAGSVGDGKTCRMNARCEVDNGGCSEHATCAQDGASTVTCTCQTGYLGDGNRCDVIDVCGSDPHFCGEHAHCENDGKGDASCSCEVGYSGDGRLCIFTDVCSVDRGGCDAHASCANDGKGGAVCSCLEGYQGDGKSCEPTPPNLDTDPANCGAVGHSCGSARCAFGQCEPEKLGRFPWGASSGVIVDSTLYACSDGGAVAAIPISGQGAREVNDDYSSLSDARCSVDGDGLVLVEHWEDETKVKRVPLKGVNVPDQSIYEADHLDAGFVPFTEYVVAPGHLYGMYWCNTIFDLPLKPHSKPIVKYSAPCDSQADMTAISVDGAAQNLYVASDSKQLFYRMSLPDMSVAETIPYPKGPAQAATSVTQLTRAGDALYWFSYETPSAFPYRQSQAHLYRMQLATHEINELRPGLHFAADFPIKDILDGPRPGPLVLSPDTSDLYYERKGAVYKVPLQGDGPELNMGAGPLIAVDDTWLYTAPSSDFDRVAR